MLEHMSRTGRGLIMSRLLASDDGECSVDECRFPEDVRCADLKAMNDSMSEIDMTQVDPSRVHLSRPARYPASPTLTYRPKAPNAYYHLVPVC